MLFDMHLSSEFEYVLSPNFVLLLKYYIFFNMAKGKTLSVKKKAIIEAYEELQLSIIEISKKIGRSRKVINK